MKFLAIADTHLGYASGRTAKARKYVQNSFFKSFDYVLQQARKRKVDYVLHAGDLFNRSKPPKKVISKTFDHIENLLNDGIGFIVVPGNHERAKLPDTLLTYFNDHFIIFRKLSKVKLDEITLIGFPFAYKSPITQINQAIKLANNDSSILLCHQLFYGAWFGPSEYHFSAKDALTTYHLPQNIKFIITGHIHRAQSIQANRVVFTGSTERSSFVEIIEPKGYLEIDIENDHHSIKFNEIPSVSMKIIEHSINGKINFNEIEDKLTEYRTLVRLTGRRLKQTELDKMYTYFPYQHWPLLSFSPKSINFQLKPIYTAFSREFEFKEIRADY